MDLQAQVEKKLCEENHLFFTRRFFKPRMGFKFMVNWHHVYVAYLIDQVVKGSAALLIKCEKSMQSEQYVLISAIQQLKAK